MRKIASKTAKMIVALMIPSMFLFSCNEDVVDPSADTMPPKDQITVPQ